MVERKCWNGEMSFCVQLVKLSALQCLSWLQSIVLDSMGFDQGMIFYIRQCKI